MSKRAIADSETQVPAALTSADVADAIALSDHAGWNQTAEDWTLFIDRGHTVGQRDEAGRWVATAAALPYGGIGWISMVLVTPAFRHRGIATVLMTDCLQWLQAQQITPVLDATPDGAQVYRRIGFEPGCDLARWDGVAGASDGPPQHESLNRVHSASIAQLDAIAALDRSASGLERRFLFSAFLSRPDSRAYLSDDASGFVIARRGRRATQIGPLVARDERYAIALLDAALSSSTGRVFCDVPSRWHGLQTRLEQRGFVRQRPFVRMALGNSQAANCGEQMFVLAGPEFG